MSPLILGVLVIAATLVLIFLRMPVGFALGLVGIIGYWWITGNALAAFSIAGITAYTTVASFLFGVIPLFVFMGMLVSHSGISEDAFKVAYKWFGHQRGGLCMATIAACTGFAAVTGSMIAGAITMSKVALPEMRKYKYDDALSSGTIVSGGILGFLIPPSVGFIIYAIFTEVSIGKLFIAGILPGLLLAFLYMATIYILCRINPQLGPAGPSVSWREKLVSVGGIWPIVVLFVLVLGGLYMGLFTPTEAGAVGAFGALVIGLGKRRLTWRGFTASLIETTRVTGMLFMLLVGAHILGYLLAMTGFSRELSDLVLGLAVSPWLVIAFILILYLVLGMITELMAILVITLPIFFPLVVGLGFDPVWFGVIVVLMMVTGAVTPPIGMAVYAISGVIRDIPMFTIFRGALPFIGAMLVATLLIAFFPPIATFLPNLMKPF